MGEFKLADLKFNGSAEQVRDVRQHVRKLLKANGCDEHVTDDVVLAIQEAITNVVRHAYLCDEGGEMQLFISRNECQWEFRLIDYAPSVDAKDFPSRDLSVLRPGGLGVYIIEQIMDTVDYVTSKSVQENVLIMTKLLEPELEKKRIA